MTVIGEVEIWLQAMDSGRMDFGFVELWGCLARHHRYRARLLPRGVVISVRQSPRGQRAPSEFSRVLRAGGLVVSGAVEVKPHKSRLLAVCGADVPCHDRVRLAIPIGVLVQQSSRTAWLHG